MLAYVFWHRSAPGVAREEYESSLKEFHRSLAADPPAGFRRSLWHRFETLPWLGGEAGYEDWYLVDGWREVGALESGAVTGSRRSPHDGVAIAAADGAGAVYGLVAGEEEALEDGRRAWFGKPPGMTYAELDDTLASSLSGGGGVWRRRLVLGPAPENCVTGTPAGALPDELAALEALGTRQGTE